MIFVDRVNGFENLGVYSQATAKAADGSKVSRFASEREKAIAFFTNPAHYLDDVKLDQNSFTFTVYKDKALARALAEGFKKKCAYCESKLAAVTPADIDHYRPKSSIATGTRELKPGYYWMAGDWENLLLSCPYCNRVHKHEVPGQSENIRLGKGTQFPLSDEEMRVRNHADDLGAEADFRLLLHPSIDRPEEHLSFDEAGLVRPKLAGAAGAKGKVSIDVYALQRKDLVEARRDELNELRSKVDDLRLNITQHYRFAEIGDAATDARRDNLAQLQKILGGIIAMMKPAAQYLAPKRQWIRDADAKGEFAILRRFGIDLTTLVAPAG